MKEIIIALLICVSTMGQTVPRDKVMHFSSCYVISATSTVFLSHKYTKNEAAWIGFGIGATVGISKEIYDMRCGHSDMKEFIIQHTIHLWIHVVLRLKRAPRMWFLD